MTGALPLCLQENCERHLRINYEQPRRAAVAGLPYSPFARLALDASGDNNLFILVLLRIARS
jgi:hypothetical protein